MRSAPKAPAAAVPAAGAVLAALAAAGWAAPPYRDGPPPGHTGGFGEPLCSECHFAASMDPHAGSLTHRIPASFEAGKRYTLVVELEHPEMAAAGFQLAVRFAGGRRAGVQAGRLESGGPRTAVTVDTATGVHYGHHTVPGTTLSDPGKARWRLVWIAPDTAAAVVVHIAANAADDDASEFGDGILSTAARVTAAP